MSFKSRDEDQDDFIIPEEPFQHTITPTIPKKDDVLPVQQKSPEKKVSSPPRNRYELTEEILIGDFNSFHNPIIDEKYSTINIYHRIPTSEVRRSLPVKSTDLLHLFAKGQVIPHKETATGIDHIIRANYEMLDGIYSMKPFFLPFQSTSDNVIAETSYCLHLYYFTLRLLNQYADNPDEIIAKKQNRKMAELYVKKNLKRLVKDAIEYILEYLFRRKFIVAMISSSKQHSLKNHLQMLITVYGFILNSDYMSRYYTYDDLVIMYNRLREYWRKNKLVYQTIKNMGRRENEIKKQFEELEQKLITLEKEIQNWRRKLDYVRT